MDGQESTPLPVKLEVAAMLLRQMLLGVFTKNMTEKLKFAKYRQKNEKNVDGQQLTL